MVQYFSWLSALDEIPRIQSCILHPYFYFRLYSNLCQTPYPKQYKKIAAYGISLSKGHVQKRFLKLNLFNVLYFMSVGAEN